MIPPVVETAILNWITDKDPRTLQRDARQEASLADQLNRERGWQLPLARHLLSEEDIAAIGRMDQADFEALLDVLLMESPDHGVVCWQHKGWYLQQMQDVQSLFIARMQPKRRRTGGSSR